MNTEDRLRTLLFDHEVERRCTTLARHIQQEAALLKEQLTQARRAPRLSQVRSLSNVLAPQGAGDSPAQRLARLHELAADQWQRARQQNQALPPIAPPGSRARNLPDSFWLYVAGRLVSLRSGNWDQPGETENLWRGLHSRDKNAWPERPDAATLADIHLRLAEAFVHHLIETWEYSESEAAQ